MSDGAALLEQVGERVALDQLHDVEGPAVGQAADLMDGHNAGMLELSADLGLGLEAGDHLSIVGELLAQHLDRDRPAQGDVFAEVDRAHAAVLDLAAQVAAGDRRQSFLFAVPTHAFGWTVAAGRRLVLAEQPGHFGCRFRVGPARRANSSAPLRIERLQGRQNVAYSIPQLRSQGLIPVEKNFLLSYSRGAPTQMVFPIGIEHG